MQEQSQIQSTSVRISAVKAYFRPCSDVGQAEEQVAVVTANVFDVAGQISALYLEALNHTAWPSSKSDAGRAMTNYLSHMARAMERTVKRIGIRTTEGEWSAIVESSGLESEFAADRGFRPCRILWRLVCGKSRR